MPGVRMATKDTSFDARVSSSSSNAKIELHLDSQTETQLGTCDVSGASSWTRVVDLPPLTYVRAAHSAGGRAMFEQNLQRADLQASCQYLRREWRSMWGMMRRWSTAFMSQVTGTMALR